MVVQHQHEESPLPRTSGKFEIIERIGQGGMAEVFKARVSGAAGFERTVVLKRILPHLAEQPGFLTMFINEAKIAASIHHHNVVQVYELGQFEDGEFYIAMEYVPGIDLKRLIAEGLERGLLMPVWFALHSMVQVLHGLSFAHELTDSRGQPRGIVHRDVTPRNIFVADQGQAKLADFGIARAIDSRAESKAGQVRGSVYYVAPETLLGGQIDHRSDIFSAGVCLYESLTGTVPFYGESNFATARLICAAPRQPPSLLNPHVNQELDGLVLSALQVDPNARFASARSLQSRLMQVLAMVRPQRHPAEVRAVIEILTGRRPPEPGIMQPLGILSASDRRPPAPSVANITSSLLPVMIPTEATTGPMFATGEWAIPSDVLDPTGSFPAVNETSGQFEAPQMGGITDTLGWGGIPAAALETGLPNEQLQPAFQPTVKQGHPLGHVPIAPLASPPPSTEPDWLLRGAELQQFATAPGLGAPGINVNQLFEDRFYLQTAKGHSLNPVTSKQLLDIARNRRPQVGKISYDGLQWSDAESFASYAGVEGLALVRRPLDRVAIVGELEASSLISIIVEIAKTKSTGRLVLMHTTAESAARRDVHFEDGMIGYVGTDHPALLLPDLFVQHGVIAKEEQGPYLKRVLAQERPIEKIVAETKGGNIDKAWTQITTDRLAELFQWRHGRFAFSKAPGRREPSRVNDDAFALIRKCVRKMLSNNVLRRWAEPRYHTKWAPDRGFELLCRSFRFSDRTYQSARRLAKGGSLSEIIQRHPEAARNLLEMHYLLVQSCGLKLAAPSQ